MYYLHHKFDLGIHQRTAVFYTHDFLSKITDINFKIYYNVDDSKLARLPLALLTDNSIMLFPEKYTLSDSKRHHESYYYKDKRSLATLVYFPEKDFKYIEPRSPQDISNPKYDYKPYFVPNNRNTKTVDDTFHEQRFAKIKTHLLAEYAHIINTS